MTNCHTLKSYNLRFSQTVTSFLDELPVFDSLIWTKHHSIYKYISIMEFFKDINVDKKSIAIRNLMYAN